MTARQRIIQECPNCGRHCNPALTVCVSCWALIPLALRDVVKRAWRAYTFNPTDENYDAYFAARDRARESLRGK